MSGLDPEKIKKRTRRYYYSHREEKISKAAEYRRRMRRLAIAEYGGKCACCGETQYEFLSFDHINDNGTEDRKEHYANRASWFLKLIEKHPLDIQILCHNCNCARGYYGICPHEKKRQEDILSKITE